MKQEATNPRSIVLITTDQQSAAAMSCSGNPYLSTPNMDRLAQRGVRYDQAYCAFPLCTPSRAALYAGRFPHELGVEANGQAISEEHRERVLGLVLSRAGYKCGYAGKWHVPTIPMVSGYGFSVVAPFNDAEIASAVDRFLESQTSDRPVFLAVNFDDPHNICEWRREQSLPWGDIGDPPAPEACPPLPANFAIPPDEPELIRSATLTDPRVYANEHYTPDQWRRYRWAYYRLVERVDRRIGQLLDVIERRRFLDSAVLIFTSDHGDGHGAHRLSQKSFFYEESSRVPLIVCRPGDPEAGTIDSESLVSASLDVYQTVRAAAGVGESPPLERCASGINLLDRTSSPFRRDSFVAAETKVGTPLWSGRMVRSPRYKYCAWEWGANREQLHDLEQDPGEMVNLARSAAHASELRRHREFLRQWCEVTADTFDGHHYGHPEVPFMIPGDQYPRGTRSD